MAGAADAPGPAVQLVQKARQAAALDSLLAARATGLFDRLIVVTNDPLWASDLPLDCVVDLDDTRHPFHFGRRLASVIAHYGLTQVLYLGAGAAPLLGATDLARVAESVLSAESLVVTNNLHSTDWAAFTPAAAVGPRADRVVRDNALAWVLHREAGIPADAWIPTAASRLDIDTPTDLLILSLLPECGQHLAAMIAGARLDTSRLSSGLRVLADEGRHVIVAGRVASSTWSALERETLCWVRLIAEERGMVASGRQENGQVRSLLGAYLDEVGFDRFFDSLDQWADAVFMDNRVLLAHRGIWPSAEDRYASDLGWVERVQDSFLRSLTEGAATVSIPVIFGGHSLVSGGLLALAELAGRQRRAQNTAPVAPDEE